ncbi:DUF664 domain-containing protein [Streptomyces chitinivorans]|uniref:DUF664 domain-containing protein n=1 Tax=Streptomyces chitinivorans TaxID=1257027 RepID=A0ABW7HR10_9ACTN
MASAYLDHYRDTVLRKLAGLSEAELRGSRLPSGWSPLELLWHLTCVERRWFRWGFTVEPLHHGFTRTYLLEGFPPIRWR